MLDPMAQVKKKVKSATGQSEVTYRCRTMQRRSAGSRTLRLDDHFKAADGFGTTAGTIRPRIVLSDCVQPITVQCAMDA